MDRTGRPHASTARGAPLYLGLAATTGAMLLLQVYLTRVFTVLFHSSFAFMAISLAFLGLGAAGVGLYLYPSLCRAQAVPALALAFAVTPVVAFLVVVGLDRRLAGDTAELGTYLVRVLVAGLLMVPTFFLGGLLLARLFRDHVARAARLYAADLTGAGAGCLLALPLLTYLGGDRAIFALGAVAAFGAWNLARAYGVGGGKALLLTVLFAAAPLLDRYWPLLRIPSYATPQSHALPARIRAKLPVGPELYAGWSPLARIGVFRTHSGRSLYVRIDSSCQTSIPYFTPEALAARRRTITFEALPFALCRHDRYLEIGAGGGEGMVTAYLFGARRILGVEINPVIVDCARRRFARETHMDRFFALPDVDVDLVVGEGRSYVRRLKERFDTVTITFIQTGAASATTAFALSEANLFTVEAFAEFMDRLTPDGLFYVYRHGGFQMLRVLSIFREVYRRRGVADPRPYLFVARDRELNHAVALASARPFRPDEVARLLAEAERRGVEVLYAPEPWGRGRPPNPLLEEVAALRREGRLSAATLAEAYWRARHNPEVLPLEATYLRAPDPDRFCNTFFLDIRPTTDDRPYFFFFSLRHPRDFHLYFDPRSLAFLGGIVVLLFWLLLVFALLVTAVILLPLVWRRGAALKRTGALALLAYFAVLGAGYIAIEVSFIQRFTLFLGHPLYAVAVVLAGFLVCTGVGSLLSERLAARGWSIPKHLLLVPPLLLAYELALPPLFHSDALAWPVGARILVSLVLLLPLGATLGFLFPQGLRHLERKGVELVPWAWGTNSAASVLGSIVALIVAIHWGFRAVLCGATVLYLAGLAVVGLHPAWRRP